MPQRRSIPFIARLLPLLLMLLPAATQAAPEPRPLSPVEQVDPFIGTDGTGHTFPGPSRPFGMIQPGPDNADTGWEYTSGYQYRAPKIIGFSQNRASGTGIPELGDLLLQPGLERRADMASTYAKASEVARPGYYAVTLADNGVRVELTSTLRSAFHRYTFSRGGRVWLLVDLQHGLTFRTDRQPVLAVANRFTRWGFAGEAQRRNWTTRHLAWAVRFDHPIAAVEPIPARPGDAAPRFWLGFDLGVGRSLRARVGLATTDAAGARANRDERGGWDFDTVVAESMREWHALLGRARISAPPAQQRIFATALYHAFLHPSVISDVDGRWRGPDQRIRRVRRGLRYSTLSLWDTFRAAQPLITLLAPERVNDIVATLIDHAEAAGRLPKWPIWGGETGTMIGEPALPVIAEAWAKGFRGIDGGRALAAMVRTSTRDAQPLYPGDTSLSLWSLYDRYGYYPFDLAGGEAVSRTLEAGIGDAATARMARMLGEERLARRFAARAGSWRRLLDPETRLARGRDSQGRWRTPFDPLTPTSPLNNPGDYTEANAWQYSWTPALHDPRGLAAALGGPAGLRTLLDRFFFGLKPTEGAAYLGQEAMIGQYAHGNEPSHHVAWLYAFTDRPETGHALVSRIARDFYRDRPDGIIGNEDAGQMSAWYVFATLGFYPVDPASGTYVAGLPLVTEATLRVPGRQVLTIRREGEGDRLARVTLDRRALPLTRMPHRALVAGGVLRFAALPVTTP
ncbi:glycoside hydrolase family 92 protein [Novosphingobium flavum]|uniref:Glycoside hydrolase family 92 protein n=1 Tax=Novosphingobium aerophilum TaxID=2839843 RepID=A0A7X1FAJ1_9SPHN|nr:GH92 family glycosyl hydrolase [Novosphingobium aerophilum]MBC2653169.1 glycoside hydrolase family 92 protein [Novosphingobium aerophilum]MBC2661760.1 glycoside hydrolase family 92 protein [Novosphingobium aerophilum]